jgi:hypothetical protein
MDQDHEALGDEPAAAFEALRAEVAALRASLGADGGGRVAPDYAPTLGKMAASLAKIEAHPALQLTPEAFAYQVRQARDAAQQQGSRDMSAAIQRVDAAGAGLERLAERQRTGREQVRQAAIMTAVGAVAGVIVWVGLSGPIARALPAGWNVPERMAAATLRLNRWDAGARLMRNANPEAWSLLANGLRVWTDNAKALEQCSSRAAAALSPDDKGARCAKPLLIRCEILRIFAQLAASEAAWRQNSRRFLCFWPRAKLSALTPSAEKRALRKAH